MQGSMSRRLIVGAAVLSPLVVAQPAFAQNTAANEAVVRRFYADVLSQNGNLDALNEVMAESFIPQLAADVPGRDAYRQRRVDQREAMTMFSAWGFVIDDLMALDSRVVVRGRIEAVGWETDAQPVQAGHLAWFVLDGGLITRLWSETDVNALVA